MSWQLGSSSLDSIVILFKKKKHKEKSTWKKLRIVSRFPKLSDNLRPKSYFLITKCIPCQSVVFFLHAQCKSSTRRKLYWLILKRKTKLFKLDSKCLFISMSIHCNVIVFSTYYKIQKWLFSHHILKISRKSSPPVHLHFPFVISLI